MPTANTIRNSRAICSRRRTLGPPGTGSADDQHFLRHPVAVDGQLREKSQLHALLGGFASPAFHLLQIPLGLPQVPIHLNPGHSDGLQEVLLPD